ncbi:hypothetical protein XENOCAPTIV_001790, partial [Xenoophorus captivus]
SSRSGNCLRKLVSRATRRREAEMNGGETLLRCCISDKSGTYCVEDERGHRESSGRNLG